MASRAKKHVRPHSAEIVAFLTDCVGGRRLWDVFRDWVAACAYTLSNQVDPAHRVERERAWESVMGHYTPEDQTRFAAALGHLVLAYEEDGFVDVLGQLFMQLDFGDDARGQYFTPPSLARLLADVMFSSGDLQTTIASKGFITLSEPACGSGGMILAAASALEDRGFDPRNHLHVTAQDIDPVAVHMTYVQLTLLGIPALVVHGDTLAAETRSWWVTFRHVAAGWDRRLTEVARTDAPPCPAEIPVLEAGA